jgi:hypothetical protein
MDHEAATRALIWIRRRHRTSPIVPRFARLACHGEAA